MDTESPNYSNPGQSPERLIRILTRFGAKGTNGRWKTDEELPPLSEFDLRLFPSMRDDWSSSEEVQ